MEWRYFFYDRIDFSDKVVLDAGTGDGIAIPVVLTKRPRRIYAVDKEPSLFPEARKNVPEPEQKVVSFVEGNVANMHFLEDNSIDIALVNYWIGRVRQGIPDASDYLRELYRVLKHGGYLLILDEQEEDLSKFDKRFVLYMMAGDAIKIFLDEALWRDHSKEWMERRVLDAMFVIEESISHEQGGYPGTGLWLRKNIECQIEEAMRIEQENVRNALVDLLVSVKEQVGDSDTFWTGTEYSILARK